MKITFNLEVVGTQEVDYELNDAQIKELKKLIQKKKINDDSELYDYCSTNFTSIFSIQTISFIDFSFDTQEQECFDDIKNYNFEI